MKSIASKLLAMVPWSKAKPVQSAPAGPLPLPDAPVSTGAQDLPLKPDEIHIAGSEPGWLRVLNAQQLLATVRAERAITQIWSQSHQSQAIWERDLLPAIRRYAEFVQLMPASEAHHHAHAGGLLSHTIEMLLAAMTWRNAHLLPGGSQIEIVDAQRDQWTYVVFFCALLHDIAKPMTDLRIAWRPVGENDPIRWAPAGGSLSQIAGQRTAEYLVDFAPKGQRDYSAHAKLAQLLLPRIAPESALRFLAHTPTALDALEQYLTGQDKDSLVAKIVKRADQLSTQRALQKGSKARFATAKAVPLIELLMQSMRTMLHAGTQLPLNRNGAAGWVFEGAIWFVAKRLADTVREHIQANEPDESVPGNAKNDRLFDTWQDYGAIELNPASGQAVWHVTVHGYAEDGSEQGAYMHDFAMLKFPLAKLFNHESKYPAAMRGRLEIRDRRKDGAGQDEHQAAAALSASESAAAIDAIAPAAAASSAQPSQVAAKPAKQRLQDAAEAKKHAAIMREPTFTKPPNAAAKPRPAATTAAAAKTTAPETPSQTAAVLAVGAPTAPVHQTQADTAYDEFEAGTASRSGVPTPLKLDYDSLDNGEAAYLLGDSEGSYFLDPSESATASDRPGKKNKPARNPQPAEKGAAPLEQPFQDAAAVPPPPAAPPQPATLHQPPQAAATAAARPPSVKPAAAAPPPAPNAPKNPAQELRHDQVPRSQSVSAEFKRMAAELDELDDLPVLKGRTVNASPPPAAAATPGPVLLLQPLPDIDANPDKPPPEPSPLALAFMQWVQMGLVNRELKFNETGAAIHFVEEGMALISPKIFKEYARYGDREDGHEDLTVDELSTKTQREVIKCGWHLPAANRTNIIRYEIHSRGTVVAHLSCVVLTSPGRWVQPIPPSNPALKMV
ncbi:MobH family relaxase [Comamonas sp. E6]|uniref:MobH family relaxase n=1 Tax=Comamonas sp. E6 TaxID=364029 RepID=UPI0006378283|nr:MobH family relaxase [Comamonas sp. E6]GAO72885.1 hypothetical protein CSE6_027_43220 [Comamonas sp. E6]